MSVSDKKHVVTANVIKASQSAGHNDETTEKSLLCVKEVSMKVNASRGFIGIMGLLSWFSLDFTRGCNLCKSTICQFTLKENKPVPNCETVNGLRYDTCPCSKVWPVSSHFTSSIMCVCMCVYGQSLGWVCVGLIVSDQERKYILWFNLGEAQSRHIQNYGVLTHHQFHFGFSCTVP